MNDNLFDSKQCVRVCKDLKCNVMVVFLRAQTVVERDVHMKCKVAELSEKLLVKTIHEN